MKQNTPPDTENILQKFEERQDQKFEKIENLLKVIDEKNEINERNLRWEIKTEVFAAKESIEKTVQAQINISTRDIKKELNERITHVGDLIAESFSKKIQNHEKRISKLEKLQISV